MRGIHRRQEDAAACFLRLTPHCIQCCGSGNCSTNANPSCHAPAPPAHPINTPRASTQPTSQHWATRPTRPHLGLPQRAHEHLVQPQRVSAKLAHNVIRVDHIAPAEGKGRGREGGAGVGLERGGMRGRCLVAGRGLAWAGSNWRHASPHANVPGAISAWAGAHTAPAPQCQPSPEWCSAARADLLLDILCARWVTLTLGSALSTNPPARGSTSEGSSLHGVGGWVGGVEVGVQPGGGAGSKLGKTQGSACCSRQDKSQLQGGHAPPYMHMQINAYACTQTCQAHFCHCPGPNPT